MRAVLAVLFLAGLAGCRARVPGFTDGTTRLGRKSENGGAREFPLWAVSGVRGAAGLEPFVAA